MTRTLAQAEQHHSAAQMLADVDARLIADALIDHGADSITAREADHYRKLRDAERAARDEVTRLREAAWRMGGAA